MSFARGWAKSSSSSVSLLLALFVVGCSSSDSAEAGDAEAGSTGAAMTTGETGSDDSGDPLNCEAECLKEVECNWEKFDSCMSSCERWAELHPECADELAALNACAAELSCLSWDTYVHNAGCYNDENHCGDEDRAFWGCVDSCP